MLRICLTFVLLLVIWPVHGQLPDAQPYIATFKPSLDVYPQNFSIASDNAGNVFIGNSDGVVVYDGDTWHLAPTNGDLVRSLAFDGIDRVYVGGFNTFGYVERDEFGEFQFTDLTPLYVEEIDGDLFADIWAINVNDQGVFFVGLEHLFVFDATDGTNSGFWKHADSFGPIATFGNQTWLQWRGEGLKSFDGDAWSLHEHPGLDVDFLAALVPLDESLYIVNVENPWSIFQEGKFLTAEGTMQIPLRNSVTNAFVASDDVVGLTTQLGVVVFYNLVSRQAEIVKVTNGFLPEVVHARSGNLLVVDDEGFKAFDWPGRWQVIGPNSGLAGSVHGIYLFNNNMYVLTSSGAFGVDGNQGQFQRLAWTDYEAWDLLRRDSGEILFADSYEIKVIDPQGQITTIEDNTTARVFRASKFWDELVFVGTEFGIQILEKAAGTWHVRATVDDLTNLTVTHLVETAPGQLLIGSARGGIHSVTVDEINWQVSTHRLTSEEGIEYGKLNAGAYVYQLDDELLASTGAGVFRFNGEGFEVTDLQGIAAFGKEDEALQFAQVDDKIWAYDSSRIFSLDDEWHEEDASLISVGANTVLTNYGDQILVGNLGSVLVYDSSAKLREASANPLKLNTVLVGTPEAEAAVRRSLTDISISTADERITFGYAIPDFRNPGAAQYRTRLQPIETRFSGWTGGSQQSFVDLNAGSYQLMVQARDSAGSMAAMTIPFEVLPQWYETFFARVVYGLIALFLAYVWFRYVTGRRSRVLARENLVLEEKVLERTLALESANKQLERMAHMDGLTQIPNRRRLDDYLRDVFEQSLEREREMAIALIDIDHFKQYNDTHGHQAGDKLLVALAKLLSRNLRRSEDLVARYGGEEFLIVMPGADEDASTRVVDDMRQVVEQSDLGVTISGGVASIVPSTDISLEALIESADQALYAAKNSGRNKVLIAEGAIHE